MTTVAVARAADTLTLARLALAVMVAIAIATDRLLLGSVFLVFGWMTDTVDGRLVRRAPGITRLGSWDAPIDSMLGLGRRWLHPCRLVDPGPRPGRSAALCSQ